MNKKNRYAQIFTEHTCLYISEIFSLLHDYP